MSDTNETFHVFMRMIEQNGEDWMLNEIYDYFGAWKMEECLKSIDNDWELGMYDDEERWRND